MESYALIYLMVCEFELWDWWQPSFDTYGGILSRLTYDTIIIEFCKQKNKQDPNCGSSESFVWILLMRLGCFLCKYCSGFCMSRVVSTWVCFWGLCEYFAVILLRRNEVVCIWVLLLRFERFCLLNISLAFALGRCISGQRGGKLHEMQLFRNYQEDAPFAAQKLILRPIFAD